MHAAWAAKERFMDRLAKSVVRRAAPQIAQELLNQPQIFGPPERLHIAKSAVVNNAFFNTTSGEITIGEWGMISFGSYLMTGYHDITKLSYERQITAPFYGCDITLGEGAWLAVNVIVLGPCTIGEHAVVAAGTLVRHDVAPYSIVAGAQAKVIGEVPH
jgi:acetyltransferase-like isoleucine patch superfamily enzyme